MDQKNLVDNCTRFIMKSISLFIIFIAVFLRSIVVGGRPVTPVTPSTTPPESSPKSSTESPPLVTSPVGSAVPSTEKSIVSKPASCISIFFSVIVLKKDKSIFTSLLCKHGSCHIFFSRLYKMYINKNFVWFSNSSRFKVNRTQLERLWTCISKAPAFSKGHKDIR